MAPCLVPAPLPRLLAGSLPCARGGDARLAVPRRPAHGPVPLDPPTLASLALGWRFEPLVAVRAGSSRRSAGCPRPARRAGSTRSTRSRSARTAAFLGGLAAIAVALLSGIERYDTTLFSIHMVQHLLLLLVAAPLLALAAPVTQLLRAASPGTGGAGLLPRPPLRRRSPRWAIRSWPGWPSPSSCGSATSRRCSTSPSRASSSTTSSTACSWASGSCSGGRSVAADPARRRLGYPARVLYLLLQMPPNSFLGMAITFAATPLYPHYATLGVAVRHHALADQQASRRDHVARRRRGVHRGRARGRRRLDATRGARHGRRGAPGGHAAGGDRCASRHAGESPGRRGRDRWWGSAGRGAAGGGAAGGGAAGVGREGQAPAGSGEASSSR